MDNIRYIVKDEKGYTVAILKDVQFAIELCNTIKNSCVITSEGALVTENRELPFI